MITLSLGKLYERAGVTICLHIKSRQGSLILKIENSSTLLTWLVQTIRWTFIDVHHTADYNEKSSRGEIAKTWLEDPEAEEVGTGGG